MLPKFRKTFLLRTGRKELVDVYWFSGVSFIGYRLFVKVVIIIFVKS